MHVMKERFTAVVEPVDEGGFWAHCPEVAGANGQGDTAEEAEENLNKAIQLTLKSKVLDEAAWVFEAARLGITTREAIVAWADEKIMQMDQPPNWLIELSTLESSDARDHAPVIAAHLTEPLDINLKVSLVVAAFEQGVIDLGRSLGILFRLWIPLPPAKPTTAFPESIGDLSAEWDQIADVEPLPEDFISRCRAAFADHLERKGRPPSAIQDLLSTISPC
jgi:predicted RNase H-like HicB family nuclease